MQLITWYLAALGGHPVALARSLKQRTVLTLLPATAGFASTVVSRHSNSRWETEPERTRDQNTHIGTTWSLPLGPCLSRRHNKFTEGYLPLLSRSDWGYHSSTTLP